MKVNKRIWKCLLAVLLVFCVHFTTGNMMVHATSDGDQKKASTEASSPTSKEVTTTAKAPVTTTTTEAPVTTTAKVEATTSQKKSTTVKTGVQEDKEESGGTASKKSLTTAGLKGAAAPTITAKNLRISQGDAFDPLTDVTARDGEGNDITSKIQVVSNDVDPMTPGTYSVTYKVTDDHGVEASMTISVRVYGDFVDYGIDESTATQSTSVTQATSTGTQEPTTTSTTSKKKTTKKTTAKSKKTTTAKENQYSVEDNDSNQGNADTESEVARTADQSVGMYMLFGMAAGISLFSIKTKKYED